MATKSRLVLSHVVGERSQKMADRLVTNTAKKLKSIPLFATDGLKLYTILIPDPPTKIANNYGI